MLATTIRNYLLLAIAVSLGCLPLLYWDYHQEQRDVAIRANHQLSLISPLAESLAQQGKRQQLIDLIQQLEASPDIALVELSLRPLADNPDTTEPYLPDYSRVPEDQQIVSLAVNLNRLSFDQWLLVKLDQPAAQQLLALLASGGLAFSLLLASWQHYHRGASSSAGQSNPSEGLQALDGLDIEKLDAEVQGYTDEINELRLGLADKALALRKVARDPVEDEDSLSRYQPLLDAFTYPAVLLDDQRQAHYINDAANAAFPDLHIEALLTALTSAEQSADTPQQDNDPFELSIAGQVYPAAIEPIDTQQAHLRLITIKRPLESVDPTPDNNDDLSQLTLDLLDLPLPQAFVDSERRVMAYNQAFSALLDRATEIENTPLDQLFMLDKQQGVHVKGQDKGAQGYRSVSSNTFNHPVLGEVSLLQLLPEQPLRRSSKLKQNSWQQQLAQSVTLIHQLGQKQLGRIRRGLQSDPQVSEQYREVLRASGELSVLLQLQWYAQGMGDKNQAFNVEQALDQLLSSLAQLGITALPNNPVAPNAHAKGNPKALLYLLQALCLQALGIQRREQAEVPRFSLEQDEDQKMLTIRFALRASHIDIASRELYRQICKQQGWQADFSKQAVTISLALLHVVSSEDDDIQDLAQQLIAVNDDNDDSSQDALLPELIESLNVEHSNALLEQALADTLAPIKPADISEQGDSIVNMNGLDQCLWQLFCDELQLTLSHLDSDGGADANTRLTQLCVAHEKFANTPLTDKFQQLGPALARGDEEVVDAVVKELQHWQQTTSAV
ncbi:hypothetical protein [Aliagarivorans taiwanensis]|uniref:hypothetical protein n=1 Tax=Aliagarivorans taiwanensis TaxID=561966 RepID=UPI0004072EE4|nr:hypothetical protein [Aliagarivorans taiwanensis]